MEDRIRAWLEEQGYPLEMRTAEALKNAGFKPIQSDYYRDPETEAWREIDVVGVRTWDRDEKHACSVRIMFVAECKSSRDKPWLLFTSPKSRIAAPARIVQRVSTHLGHTWLRAICHRKDIQDLSLFSVASTPAYGITQAFRSGADVTYGAAMGVAKASVAYAEGMRLGSQFTNEWAMVVFPVLVTEARLFTCTYDESIDSRIRIQEVRHGDLLWRNPLADHPHTIIKVLTADYLQEFFKVSSMAANELINKTGQELERSVQTMQARLRDRKLQVGSTSMQRIGAD